MTPREEFNWFRDTLRIAVDTASVRISSWDRNCHCPLGVLMGGNHMRPVAGSFAKETELCHPMSAQRFQMAFDAVQCLECSRAKQEAVACGDGSCKACLNPFSKLGQHYRVRFP